MNKEEHNKIIDFVNSDDYMLLASYISKPYEETIVEQDKEIDRLNNIINKAIEYIIEDDLFYYGDELYDSYQEIINILKGEDKIC